MSGNTTAIPGILYLEGNKTFGRTQNKKRLLYKCIPHDKMHPTIFIPYDIKIGFQKTYKNKFILFINKEPHPEIKETIGDVDIPENYYEYQLYCKKLYHPLTEMKTRFQENIHATTNTPPIINDENQTEIISIDNTGTTTYDDAFSITDTHLTIYISNVYYYLEKYNLTETLTKRAATIYLPNKRVPMLIPQLTDKCSLKENTEQIAVAFVFNIQNIISAEYPTIIPYIKINITKNMTYEEADTATNATYNKLNSITPPPYNINSRKTISYWMTHLKETMTNYFDQNSALKNKIIYHEEREHSIIEEYLLNKNIDAEADNTRKTLAHITSPIRRLPDLINQILLIQHLTQTITAIPVIPAIPTTDEINNSIKKINKLQLDSYILENINKIDLTKEYAGKILHTDNTTTPPKHLVYFENIKLLTRYKGELPHTHTHTPMFKIYLFEKKETLQKKIKIGIV